MSFAPRFTVTNAITTALTRVERARGFLEAAKLSEDWVRRMGERALVLEAHHTTHIEGTRLGNATRGLPDHERQLGLRIDVTDAGGQHDRLAVTAERVRELPEQERRFRQLHARLPRMVAVIEPDADDLRIAVAEPVAPLLAHAHGAVTSPSASNSRKRATVCATPSSSGVSV